MTEEKRRREAGWPDKLRDVESRMARLKSDVHTGAMVIPAGKLGTLSTGSRSWNALRFTSERCDCCGVRAIVHGLSWRDLEFSV